MEEESISAWKSFCRGELAGKTRAWTQTVCMAVSIGEKFSLQREIERVRVCLLENVAEVSRITRRQIHAGL